MSGVEFPWKSNGKHQSKNFIFLVGQNKLMKQIKCEGSFAWIRVSWTVNCLSLIPCLNNGDKEKTFELGGGDMSEK